MTATSPLCLLPSIPKHFPSEVEISTPAVSPVEARERMLLTLAQDGDVDAFYALVRSYERPVFLTALAVLKNEADAEEVAQEAILKAFKNITRFRQESKFSTWLIQIAMNEARMRLRKDRRHLYDAIEDMRTGDDGDYVPAELADWREIPSDSLERKELREALTQALKALPEKYRSVLILRDIQQLNIAETAQLLGITEANVKTRLSRARMQMRKALASAHLQA
jgi:RNA polymerase sigma-70 factor (ECF subfamily)